MNENTNADTESSEYTDGNICLGGPTSQSYSTSGSHRGSTFGRASKGSSGGQIGENSSDVRDNIRTRSRPRVPQVDPTQSLLQAFLEGDFEKAYNTALELQKAYHGILTELAKLRFELYFGSDMCRNCEGLKAGPGVLATCFQTQRCDFTNVREDTEGPQLAIVSRLTSG